MHCDFCKDQDKFCDMCEKGSEKMFFENLTHTIVVGKRGVITLPSKIREALTIEEGTPLKVVVDENNFIVIMPVNK